MLQGERRGESESVVQLEFQLSDSIVPITSMTKIEGCRFTLEEIVPQGDGRCATFYSIDGCDSDRILTIATESEACEAQFLSHSDSGGLLELRITDDLPITVLAAHGALPRRLVVEDGKMIITVEVPPVYDANEIISRFTETYPNAELTARRQQSHFTPLFSHREFKQAINNCLTDRQYEVLRAAFEEEYFGWPREITGEQLSEKLGISPATFHQHLRAALQKLIKLVLEDGPLRGA